MHRFMTVVITCAMLLVGSFARGQATQPAPGVEEKRPEPKISEPAKAVMNLMRDGYAKAKSLDLAGTVKLNLDAAGEKENKSGEFTSSFQAPVSFRHEMKDDMMVVSNGEKAFVYKLDVNKYITVDAPKERTELDKLADPIVSQLQQQNPSLLMALMKDAAAAFVDGVESVEKADDVTLNGIAYQALVLKSPGQEIKALIDPKSGLLRQMNIDLKAFLMSRNVPQVNSAMITIDYTKSAADAPVEVAGFNWTPPKDATLVKLPPPDAQDGPGGGQGEAMALVGKEAPAFNLKDMDGKDVSLASLKGNVVVLDFWATWCGPCVQSMPHVAALSKEMAPKGVKVFAVNLKEAPTLVRKFLDEQKLNLPVLLDSEGKVGDLYKANAIPETVVIGKDGNVSRVFVGFGPGGENQLREAVEAALK